MTNLVAIYLLPDFGHNHQHLISKYLAEGRWALSLVEWRQALRGFELLHQAQAILQAEGQDSKLTFRQIYDTYIDHPFADLYITELLKLPNVRQESVALRARLARAIAKRLQQAGFRRADLPETNLLLAYCLYFWESFAAGYALEVEIYRDLTVSGIAFEAHDLRDRTARLSPYDLKVLGQRGDIKTSLYFLQVESGRGLPNDFYVTRFYEGPRQRTLVVMLKSKAWEEIDGDTVAAALEEAIRAFPSPVRVELETGTIIVADYATWKNKVLQRQPAVEVTHGE